LVLKKRKEKKKRLSGRTEADYVVVPRTAVYDIPHPSVILDPPDESLWAALDFTDFLLARDNATRELIPGLLVRVQHDLDPTQPACELLLDAAYESLRACAGAPEHLAHTAHGEAELPRVARLGVRRRGNSIGERSTAREVRWEWDGEGCVRDWEGRLEITL
jgi:hypothetical protein